jgi:hypothetical protein
MFGLEEALDQINREVDGSLSIGPFAGRRWPLRFRPGSFEKGVGVIAATTSQHVDPNSPKGSGAMVVSRSRASVKRF